MGGYQLCGSCFGGRYLYMGGCVAVCPGGMYGWGGRCEHCGVDCEECETGSVCGRCASGVYQYRGQCYRVCPA